VVLANKIVFLLNQPSFYQGGEFALLSTLCAKRVEL
jgi:hypothetical protein